VYQLPRKETFALSPGPTFPFRIRIVICAPPGLTPIAAAHMPDWAPRRVTKIEVT